MAKKKRKQPNYYAKTIQIVSQLNREYKSQGKQLYPKGSNLFKVSSGIYKEFKKGGYNLTKETVEKILTPKVTRFGVWDIRNPIYRELLNFEWYNFTQLVNKLPLEANVVLDMSGLQDISSHEGSIEQVKSSFKTVTRNQLKDMSPPPLLELAILDERNKTAVFTVYGHAATYQPAPEIMEEPELPSVKKEGYQFEPITTPTLEREGYEFQPRKGAKKKKKPAKKAAKKKPAKPVKKKPAKKVAKKPAKKKKVVRKPAPKKPAAKPIVVKQKEQALKTKDINDRIAALAKLKKMAKGNKKLTKEIEAGISKLVKKITK